MSDTNISTKPWILSGSELSPFHLKIAAMLRFKGISYKEYPSEGGALDNLLIQLRLKRLKLGLATLTYPQFSDLDEFPLVPFLFGPNGENLYDSSAIAHWLDEHAFAHGGRQDATALVNRNDHADQNFLLQLIDDYFDEFGLYMVHHARWKMSATDNNAGQRLAAEMPMITAPIRPFIANFFSARQVRRCPYLFSVAPEGFHIDGIREDRIVRPHQDFPATHGVLEESYLNILQALEPIFASRNYLLGASFTLADASLYGQLGMNLTDPSAANFIESHAPSLYRWLLAIHRGDFPRSSQKQLTNETADLQDPLLKPLLAEIVRIYYPLMRQNEAAYHQHKQAGETLFNEAAFWQGRGIFSGNLDGHEFKSVVKTFQVKVWRNLKDKWQALPTDSKAVLLQCFPNLEPG